MLSAGTRLGPYAIVGLVDEGGMGQVYKGLDTGLDRTVAIKMLAEVLGRGPPSIKPRTFWANRPSNLENVVVLSIHII